MVVVFENELQYFIIFWFGTKCDFTYREFPILDDLKNTDPEWIFKKTVSCPELILITNPSLIIVITEMDNPEGKVTYLNTTVQTAGLPTSSSTF